MDSHDKKLWAVTSEKLDEAVRRIVQEVGPVKVVLFGSHARGGMTPDSDLDLLVIERETPDRYGEMIRLGRALRGLLLPIDLLVIGEREFEQRSRIRGTVYHAAQREGKVLYEAA